MMDSDKILIERAERICNERNVHDMKILMALFNSSCRDYDSNRSSEYFNKKEAYKARLLEKVQEGEREKISFL